MIALATVMIMGSGYSPESYDHSKNVRIDNIDNPSPVGVLQANFIGSNMLEMSHVVTSLPNGPTENVTCYECPYGGVLVQFEDGQACCYTSIDGTVRCYPVRNDLASKDAISEIKYDNTAIMESTPDGSSSTRKDSYCGVWRDEGKEMCRSCYDADGEYDECFPKPPNDK